MSAIRIEQRTNLKFLVKLGKTPTESLQMLQQVYGSEALSRTRVFEWHKRFKGGEKTLKTMKNLEGLQQAGQRTTSSACDIFFEKTIVYPQDDCR